MANAFEQVDWIAAEALMHLEDALVIANLASKDKSSDFNVTPNGYKVGDTVRIKTRPEYETKTFATITPGSPGSGTIDTQNIRESTRNMTIERLFDISVEVTAKERALDLESFSEQVIQPAAWSLAESVDQYVGTKILEAAGLYVAGGGSTTKDVFGDAPDMAEARKTATEQQLSSTGRYVLADLSLEARLLGAPFFGTWNNRGPDGVPVFTNGMMGRAMGMDFFSSINFPQQSITASLIDGAFAIATETGLSDPENQIGTSSLFCTGTGTVGPTSILAGARLKIAGVRRPVIVASAPTPISGDFTIALEDPITEIIAEGAAVTIVGDALPMDIRGAIFDDRSLAIAMPILDSPPDKPSFSASNNGVSIRVVQGYDMTSKVETLSMDLLVGAVAYDPRRITLLADDLTP